MPNGRRKKELFDYLGDTFEQDFFRKIEIPIAAQFGERVVYLLQPGKTTHRLSGASESLQELEKLASNIDGQMVEIKSPVESGYMEPRLVDLPGSDICFDLPLKRYLDSPDPMPEDCDIDWLFGVFFGHCNKKLVFIDLTIPEIKGIFSVDYDIDDDPLRSNCAVGNLFNDFYAKLQDLKKEAAERRNEIRWIKLIQAEFELTIKTMLSEEGFQKRRF